MLKLTLSLLSILTTGVASAQATGGTTRSGAHITVIYGDFSHSRNANGPQDDYYAEQAASMAEAKRAEPAPITGNFGSVSNAEARKELFMSFNAPAIGILVALGNNNANLSPRQRRFKDALKAEGRGADRSLIAAFNSNKNLILTELHKDPMSLFALLYSHPQLNRLVWDRDAAVLADAKTAEAKLPAAYVNFINNKFAPFLAKLSWSLRDRGLGSLTAAGGYLRTYDYVKDSAKK